MIAYKVLTTTSNTPEWLKLRKGGIGASEAASILGLSKWGSPLSIYLNKITDDEPDDDQTEWQRWGHALEDPIAGWVAETQGIVVLPSPGLIQSIEYPWLLSTPDRVTDKGEPVELKTSDRFMSSDWDAGVPINYIIQVHVQMLTLGKQRGFLAVLHGGNRAEFYEIAWDQGLVDSLLAVTKEFWHGNVLALNPPEPVIGDDLTKLWHGTPKLTIEGGPDLEDLWGAYGLIQAEQVELKDQLDGIKLQLQTAMQDATALTFQGRDLFTWNVRKGASRLDTAALKTAHPDIHAAFTVTGADTRTFLRKTAKEVIN